MEWRPEKLELADYKMVTNRFFVRTKADEAAVKNAFGAVEFVAAEGVNGELGFVTEEMTEAAYEEKAAKLADILQMIRVKIVAKNPSGNYNCTKGINIISGGYFYVKIYYGVRRRNHQQPVYSL